METYCRLKSPNFDSSITISVSMLLISCRSLSSRSVCPGSPLFSGPIFASFFSALSALAPVDRLRLRNSSSVSSRSRIRLYETRICA